MTDRETEEQLHTLVRKSAEAMREQREEIDQLREVLRQKNDLIEDLEKHLMEVTNAQQDK